MLEILAIFMLLIFGMPFFGFYLLIDKNQQSNRGLGVAVLIVGVIIWYMVGLI